MKIAVCQINSTVGDCAGNASVICEHVKWAISEGAHLVVFPELAMTGYPPRDLLERPSFIKENLNALQKVAESAKNITVIVGCVDWNHQSVGHSITNIAAVVRDGKIIGRQAKRLLPFYDVFDESRYFAPGQESLIFEVCGESVGITICEDSWAEHVWETDRTLYSQDPLSDLGEKDAKIVLNISASPYAVGKMEVRRQLLQNAALKHNYNVLYVNSIGGNDQLVFDGGSFLVNNQGEVVWSGEQFKQDRKIIDMSNLPKNEISISQNNLKDIEEALKLGLSDYMRKCNFSKVILGLSGGIDSALVAVLIVRALGKEALTAIAMPSRFSSESSLTDARKLSNNLGIELQEISIDEIYETFRSTMNSPCTADEPDLAEENLQARIRGSLLMTLSNRTGAMVVSTGNKSELAVGYSTLYGDMVGGLALLGDLPKTMVYELAKYINREKEIIPKEIIQKKPSAELRFNQTDQDSLPPYDILDQILVSFIEDHKSIDEIVSMGIENEIVRDVVSRIMKSEYKRLQASPCIQISEKAFGVGRRFPIAARYVG